MSKLLYNLANHHILLIILSLITYIKADLNYTSSVDILLLNYEKTIPPNGVNETIIELDL
jgi:hypothetical protein